jgi:hypothetical protein
MSYLLKLRALQHKCSSTTPTTSTACKVQSANCTARDLTSTRRVSLRNSSYTCLEVDATELFKLSLFFIFFLFFLLISLNALLVDAHALQQHLSSMSKTERELLTVASVQFDR